MGPNKGGGRANRAKGGDTRGRGRGGGARGGARAGARARGSHEAHAGGREGGTGSSDGQAGKPRNGLESGRGKGRGANAGGSASSRAPKPAGSHEHISMSEANQDLVHSILLDIRGTTTVAQEGAPGAFANPEGPVKAADVARLAVAELLKKGFAPDAVERALQATAEKAQEAAAASTSLSEHRRQRVACAVDWLILHTSAEELPAALRGSFVPAPVPASAPPAVAVVVRGDRAGARGGRRDKGKQQGRERPPPTLPQATQLTAEEAAQLTLQACGFPAPDVRKALAATAGSITEATARLLRAIQPPGGGDMRQRAADWGVRVDDAASIEAAARCAVEDELLALQAVLDLAGRDSRDAPLVDRPGMVPLKVTLPAACADLEDGATGELVVTFGRGREALYPFAMPQSLLYRNASLGVLPRVALSASVTRKAAELCGRPVLHDLLTWVAEEGERIVEVAEASFQSLEQAALAAKGWMDPAAMTAASRGADAAGSARPVARGDGGGGGSPAEGEVAQSAGGAATQKTAVDRTVEKVQARVAEEEMARQRQQARVDYLQRLLEEERSQAVQGKGASQPAQAPTSAPTQPTQAPTNGPSAPVVHPSSGVLKPLDKARSVAAPSGTRPGDAGESTSVSNGGLHHHGASSRPASAPVSKSPAPIAAPITTAAPVGGTQGVPGGLQDARRRPDGSLRSLRSVKAEAQAAKLKEERRRAELIAAMVSRLVGCGDAKNSAGADGDDEDEMGAGIVEGADAGGAEPDTAFIAGMEELTGSLKAGGLGRRPGSGPGIGSQVEEVEETAGQRRAREAREAEARARRERIVSERMWEAWDRKHKGRDAKWTAMQAVRARLPSWSQRDALVAAVERHQVVVVCGETGCGKTTQLPQFLLDAATAQKRAGSFSMVCTQPRRISATSVAMRVAEERAEPLGATVGYQIRMEAKRSAATRILFCTTGVLLRRIREDTRLEGTSHVVVDEVHERSLDSDFLLVLLRDLLPHRPDLHLILMSATLNAHVFAEYFAGCAVISIPGFTHPVEEHYLEDVLQATGYVLEDGSPYAKSGADSSSRGGDRFQAQGGGANPRDAHKKPGGKGPDGGGQRKGGTSAVPEADREKWAIAELVHRGYSKQTVATLSRLEVEKINYELMEKLLEFIVRFGEPGAILVFMPGLMEIAKLYEACLANGTLRSATGGGRYIIGLHSSLNSAEQHLVFDLPPEGIRKIVISTNIAETSVTIEDVVHVVDSGKVKETSYNAAIKMSVLEEVWVSRANAKQRRGRAGRVRPGHCFRLYTRFHHDKVLVDHQLPEIQRVSLDGLCLQIKLQRMPGGIQGFMGKALQPPSADAVRAAVENLQVLQALDKDEELTSLGYHLANLPVDARVGKMLLYGAMLGCLDPVLTIAAAMSSRSPFVSPLDKREEADRRKRLFSREYSDHIALLRAYNSWLELGKGGGTRAQYAWCHDNFLSVRTLEGMADMRRQFLQLLEEAGFLASSARRSHGIRDGHQDKHHHRGCPHYDPHDSQGGGQQAEGGSEAGRAAGRGGRGVTVAAGTAATADAKEGAASLEGGGDAVKGLHPHVAEMLQESAGGYFREENVHKDNLDLVKAVLCAGLYPNIVRVENGAGVDKPAKFLVMDKDTGMQSAVFVHPCSVNFNINAFPSQWMIYHEKVKTTQVFLRDSTMVTPYPLLLFAGSITTAATAGTVSIDGWMHFRTNPKVAILFKEVRAEIDRLLEAKIANPELSLRRQGGALVDAIVRLLATERVNEKKGQPLSSK